MRVDRKGREEEERGRRRKEKKNRLKNRSPTFQMRVFWSFLKKKGESSWKCTLFYGEYLTEIVLKNLGPILALLVFFCPYLKYC